MIKRILILFFFSSIFASRLFGQSYGNEWINLNQKYVKITVSSEGLYKVTFNDVATKNFQSGVLSSSGFKIYNKGVEIPLYLSDSQDGTFDQGDFIYFYGDKNNASLDKVLYTNQADVPNDEVSLFTDDNYYFLTYNSVTNGLRYKVLNSDPTGLVPESFIIAKDRQNFTTSYYPGEYILDAMTLSEYIEGEGYLGSSFSKGQSLSYQLNTSEYFNTNSYQPKLSFYIAGRSNASSTNSSGKNHHLRILSNSTSVFDTLYRGYATVRKSISVNLNNNLSSFSITSVDDLGALTDFQAPGYLEVSYSRTLNLSDLKSLNFNINFSKSSALLNFSNSSLTQPILLESNGLNLYQSTNTVGLQFVLSNTSNTKNYFLTDISLAKSTTLSDVLFKNINSSSSKNFLIISHNSLKSGALAYQAYNESIGIPTSLVYTDDLYDEFYYGFHHPLALRNYCSFMIDKGIVKPEYLLLLGKGFENPKQNLVDDLVPTIGFPASDNMLTSGLNGSNLEPGLITGRVPAKNNQDITNYVRKLKVYRNLSNPIWRKNLLQVTGGKTISENISFGGYQNNFYNNSKEEFFGALRSQVYKNVSTPITENQTERIIKQTRDGIALLSYFGHGSATGTEIAFGRPVDQQNPDKPTIYLVNGCSTGQCFTSGNSLGEDFILVKDVGAVGWIGTTSEGVASYLGNASLNYHNNWFKKFYSSSIAKGFKEGLKEFQNPNDKLNRAHIRQYIFLGDPSIKFSSPEKPDFNINNSYLSLNPANQNATSNNLSFLLRIENLGKATNDSLTVKIERVLPDNSIVSVQPFKIKPILNLDSIILSVSNLGLSVVGNNKINVMIDADNKFDELNELNNKATLDLFLPGNGVRSIFPIQNGIINKNTVTLRAEPDDLRTKNAEYLFEIDTVGDFSSSFKKTSPIITANLLPIWTPIINLEKNKVYFWRARLNLPMDKGGSWSNSSFTYIPEILNGFSQSNKNQLNNLSLNNIDFDIQTGKFEFKKTYFLTSIYTQGDDGPNLSAKRFRTTQAIDFEYPSFQGITLVAMSPTTPNLFFSYPSPYNSTNGPMLKNGYTGQYKWNINDPIQLDSLVRFINQIPNGYHVIGFNGLNAAFNELPLFAKNALKSFGLIKFESINRGEPYMFWGIKGKSAGSALEFTADYNSTTPSKSQFLQYFNPLPYPVSNGSITTELIGPSNQWSNMDVEYFKNNSDLINYDVIGIQNSGNEVVLFNNIAQNKFDISSINSKNYPYIKIKSNISDDKDYTVPLLKHFIVDFKPLSEISINPESKDIFHSQKIDEGDILKWEIALTNIYDYPTDSLDISYTITRPNNVVELKNLPKMAGLNSGESKNLNIEEDTKGHIGNNAIRLRSNLTDLYRFNNEISNNFEIIGDKKEPLLNILFDGKTIINGDIVSPRPIISIGTTDENKYLLLSDTSNVDIYVKKESDSEFKRVSFSNPILKFNPGTLSKNTSTILYNPDFKLDGIYTLKVRSKDVSGNYSLNDYKIDFEIINESSITHFYPYPNPVVNSMKFVFTLTGVKTPDKLKVQIYNSSGKIVRTITKEELGTLKIGNNISDFTWDGTDEFGDRLANGVYFYRVEISDSSDFKLRNTKSDKNFKNNTGKIYLLK